MGRFSYRRLFLEDAAVLGTWFGAWYVAEGTVLRSLDHALLHDLFVVRGVVGAIAVTLWSAFRLVRDHAAEDAARLAHQKSLEAQMRHQEKMAGLGILTAGFAHDLGNPLASLSTELELLEGEEDLPTLRASLGLLRVQVDRMTRTLREMVDFARRRRDLVDDVSIPSVVADAARLVRHDPRWKHIALALELPADLPSVRMVEDHLVLVLVNLMLNAADAIPDRGTVRISAEAHDDIAIRVRDDGAGMSPETLARAKTPLFTTKGPERGTGLGLSICEDILKGVGGSLELTSELGVGTEVVLRLPRPAEVPHG